MGAGSGGTSAVYNLTLNQPVSPPFPTPDASLVNSVLLYNFSPFLVQVKLGTSNAWLGAWMVDKFTIANQSITLTPILAVGGAASNSTGQITAAWILEGDDLTDVGTYPAPLFHLAQSLTLVWPDGDPAIILGPGPQIEFIEDGTGKVLTTLSPTVSEWDNSTNTGRIRIEPNGEAGTGTYPNIIFDVANTPGGYLNPMWMQAIPDSVGNPQFSINDGVYTSTIWPNNLRQLLFFRHNSISTIGAIDTTSQAAFGGQLWWTDTDIKLTVANNGAEMNSAQITRTNSFTTLPWQTGIWQNLTLANGWTVFGAPYSAAQWRLCSDGFIHLRGLIVPGTIADGTIIASVPAAAVPGQQKFLPIANDGGVPDTRVVVTTGGNIQIFGLSSAHDLSFDGMLYESGAYMA